MTQPATPLMKADEVAARLGVSREYVYDKVRDRKWPCTRMGRKVLFTETDIADILAICRVDPIKHATRKRSA